MSYQTGTVTTPAGLISAINAFAASNGWTQSAAVLGAHGVLSAGGGSVEMWVDATYPSNKINIQGANANDMVTGLCPQPASIFLGATHWTDGVTYHLFSHTVPANQIICIVQFGGIYHNWLAFGDYTKYATFTGGNYFAASWGAKAALYVNDIAMENWTVDDGSASGYTALSGSFFWHVLNYSNWGSSYASRRNSFVHAEIDGYTWPGAGETHGLYPTFSQMNYQLFYSGNQPTSWDLHAVLLPYTIFMPRSDGHYSAIGHIDNVNYCRVTYFEPGEIITIGSDKWMVFPFFRKKVSAPDGFGSDGSRDSSGTHGWAIRYDGP